MTEVNKCPYCGLQYRDFRTGETFASIQETLWVGSDDPRDWKYKRRHTVLGRWRMLKMRLWTEHLEYCRPTEKGLKYEALADY